jgi:hypothetical protein
LAFAAMPALVMAAVPSSQTGVATGMNANIRTIGGSIGSVVVATVLASHQRASGYPAQSGYVWSFVLLAVTMVAAAAASLAIPRLVGSRVPIDDLATVSDPTSVAAEAGAMLAES